MEEAQPQDGTTPGGEPPVLLTGKAVERFLEARRKEQLGPEYGLRVSVTEGGCSGNSYSVGFDATVRPDDLVVEQGGLRVLVDAESAALLRGTTIDFVESLHSSGFKFVNPNASRTCGCGTSFA